MSVNQTDLAKYNQVFDYLSALSLPDSPEATVVFGRADPLVAHAAGELAIANLAEIIVITGGIGKDSGDILKRGYRSEAHYLGDRLAQDAAERHYQLPEVILEEKAANGGENARNSLDILTSREVATSSLVAVAHATSTRRLAETLKHEAGKKTGTTPTVYTKPSAYDFDATNPADRDEAAAELLRLADWPKKGWLGKPSVLPEDLVDFVRDTHGKAPEQPAAWKSAALRAVPKRLRGKVIDLATRPKKH